MKRSEVNHIISASLTFMRDMKFHLPPFGTWTPTDWQSKGEEVREIVTAQLGWDITDFGSGDFQRRGLVLFTIRNGPCEELKTHQGKVYAEKIMVVQEGQVTPTHFHHRKMEDIINRGGGDLTVQLWNSTADNALADTPVTVSLDGLRTHVVAGGTVTLKPGESICLPQRLFHKFWGARGKGAVLVGEVSRVNDDRIDNCFFDPVGRFPEIEEDVAPMNLLAIDYPRYYPLCR
jgi:D-lyxose ketol-isomerase